MYVRHNVVHNKRATFQKIEKSEFCKTNLFYIKFSKKNNLLNCLGLKVKQILIRPKIAQHLGFKIPQIIDLLLTSICST